MKKRAGHVKRTKPRESSSAPNRATYTLELAAELTGVEPELIRYYHVSGVLGAVPARLSEAPVFDDDAIYELRRLDHYRRHFGVNRSALAFMGALLREVARLEAELRFQRHP